MDAADLDPAVYAAVLRDLARVNRWTLAARPTLAFVAQAVGSAHEFSLLDVGFGQGDMLRAVARWAARAGKRARLVGVDLNPRSLGPARAATPDGMGIEYRIGDYRDQPERFDLVVSSLVAHHMDDDELVAFVRWMEGHAARGWMVNDLHRHPLSYRGYPWLARALRVHPMVREDGTLSIARSFRPGEWRDILEAAGVPSGAARIARRFPFRLCVERLR